MSSWILELMARQLSDATLLCPSRFHARDKETQYVRHVHRRPKPGQSGTEYLVQPRLHGYETELHMNLTIELELWRPGALVRSVLADVDLHLTGFLHKTGGPWLVGSWVSSGTATLG